jgi:hypothetical protein
MHCNKQTLNEAGLKDIEDNAVEELLELHAVPWSNEDLAELGSQFWCYDVCLSMPA